MNSRNLVAEFLGTFFLVLLAVGSAVVGIKTSGVLAVAIAFGFVLILAAYAFGPVSGAHVNPAVTLAMVISRKMPIAEAAGFWVVQFIGAIAAAAVLKLFTTSFGVTDETGALGSNGYDNGHINMAGAFVLEVLLTFAFVLVILLVTMGLLLRFKKLPEPAVIVGAAICESSPSGQITSKRSIGDGPRANHSEALLCDR